MRSDELYYGKLFLRALFIHRPKIIGMWLYWNIIHPIRWALMTDKQRIKWQEKKNIKFQKSIEKITKNMLLGVSMLAMGSVVGSILKEKTSEVKDTNNK